MNINTLNILADAISEVGSWHRWLIKDDMVQVQFCDIMLYDEAKPEKETHTTDVLAVRFYGHVWMNVIGMNIFGLMVQKFILSIHTIWPLTI